MDASQTAQQAHQNLPSYLGLRGEELKVARAAYNEGQKAIREQFEKDLADQHLYGNYSDAQKAAIFDFAWQAGGKSYNDTEVHYMDTAELLNTLNRLAGK